MTDALKFYAWEVVKSSIAAFVVDKIGITNKLLGNSNSSLMLYVKSGATFTAIREGVDFFDDGSNMITRMEYVNLLDDIAYQSWFTFFSSYLSLSSKILETIRSIPLVQSMPESEVYSLVEGVLMVISSTLRKRLIDMSPTGVGYILRPVSLLLGSSQATY